MTPVRTLLLTVLALAAFAANSLLCRLTLEKGLMDAATFTSVRILSGALILAVIAAWTARGRPHLQTGWKSAIFLALYAVAFSYAYVSLTVATGALILFASVQATMMGVGLWTGERLSALEWLGFIIALAGLVALLSPGLETPSLSGALLMGIAGFAWGAYTLQGHNSSEFVNDTAGNFLRAAPLVVAVSVADIDSFGMSAEGVVLAVCSGAIASGLGYVVWYAALRGLSKMRASIVQLLVPVLAAGGGVMLLSEKFTLRLLAASALILGGVGMGLSGRMRRGQSQL